MDLPKGFLFSALSAGIKKESRLDLALIYSEVPARAAGVFTTNKIKAAPVILAEERLLSNKLQAILINSGNANACTGEEGLIAARETAAYVAKNLRISENLVITSSTGVIGIPLPKDKIINKIPFLVASLSPDGLSQVAEAILTTDTFKKVYAKRINIKGKEVTILAVAKGAGMIAPNMATMLAFALTDINIEKESLKEALKKAVSQTFNRITVDGDTSTNDSVIIMANSLAKNEMISYKDKEYKIFYEALEEIFDKLSFMIVKDGEGATKVVDIIVTGAKDEVQALKASKTVANSLLVKTALFGEDPNWGRIMAALGRSDIQIDPSRISISFDDIEIVSQGKGCGEKAEKKAHLVMKKDYFKIKINLNIGKAVSLIRTCDLTYDYVKINAEYRT
ncbi:bifunctional glutamate N-acetyltransferase/amino-acid acetyltransferase ArgJ [Thermosulfuriphilus ammonigenes]|uniref:Arginine biosynthesis bifunctional protein ArgJ n=1 Tax=Thermosulfuriphilus ammonigenes TaxID=1936021 RepID=A0A6G7PWA7_9BACT|nr:bifunctional glutamate N-acetyltransferase/amino-acid acetyltransferase ArgJ [Thermosulfuriphilus ammonigenes]MBA2847905.1 glutamate N-acetyltransferase/amino-acid N-acetyltransferase [Thermosulfuriphilus ammonigenes]QIJ71900.1 bifunctional glutamate N-acetyltransferase/amino-acid acetyltransferase ArgJ [Thermosulfuriphilus ammonigenes]